MNDTIRLLLGHRSIRRYTDEPVRDEDLTLAAAAGQHASTSSAVEAYCCLRIRDAEQRRRLVELTGNQEKVAAAGAFLVVCADTRRHRLIAARAGTGYETRLEGFLLSVIDAALFAQNMVVALESMGYGICYVGGLRNRIDEVDRLLGLPEGVYPLFGLCVGRPAGSPAPRPRLPLEAVLLDGRYPSDETVLECIDEHDAGVRAYWKARGKQPRGWSEGIAEKFRAPRRTELAGYYRAKGARLD